MKKFLKKFFNEIFKQCHSAKNVKGGTLCNFLTSIVLQNIETNEGDPLMQSKNFPKKSRIVPKKSWAKVGSLDVCFVFSFRFGRASEVGVVGV